MLNSRAGQVRNGIYNRCRIANAKIYGTGIVQHPKPIIIKCAPGYSLVKVGSEEKHFEDTFCIRRGVQPPVKCKKSESHFKTYRHASHRDIIRKIRSD